MNQGLMFPKLDNMVMKLEDWISGLNAGDTIYVKRQGNLIGLQSRNKGTFYLMFDTCDENYKELGHTNE